MVELVDYKCAECGKTNSSVVTRTASRKACARPEVAPQRHEAHRRCWSTSAPFWPLTRSPVHDVVAVRMRLGASMSWLPPTLYVFRLRLPRRPTLHLLCPPVWAAKQQLGLGRQAGSRRLALDHPRERATWPAPGAMATFESFLRPKAAVLRHPRAHQPRGLRRRLVRSREDDAPPAGEESVGREGRQAVCASLSSKMPTTSGQRQFYLRRMMDEARPVSVHPDAIALDAIRSRVQRPPPVAVSRL